MQGPKLLPRFPPYDLFEDFGLIISSFQEQYGIRLTREMSAMPWQEFCDLLAGISPDTALGRIVAVRTETNKDVIAGFSESQKAIRNEWIKKKADSLSQETVDSYLDFLLDGFKKMGGVANESK